MDRNQLASLVAKLVLEELSKSKAEGNDGFENKSSLTVVSPRRNIVVCGTPGSTSDKSAWETFRGLKDTLYTFVDWGGYPWRRALDNGYEERFCEVISVPDSWEDFVCSVDAIILPCAPLDVIAKIAHLIIDTPPVALVVAGLMRNVPVFIGGDDVAHWSRHSARIPRTIVSTVLEYVRTIQSMGATVDSPDRLVAKLVGDMPRFYAGKTGGRLIIVSEDIMTAVDEHRMFIEVPSGTIVTSLAYEIATKYGIEVRFR